MPSPPAPDPEDTLIPRIGEARAFAAGRYTERRLLNEGSQKVVYLVHDEELDRDCALSMIKAELLEPDDLERLRREAQAMASLGAHSNIVSVFDFGREDGKPYLVCEYVPAGELRAELRTAGGPLALERALTIAADIARALAVAHDRGVIHRDVKPANVFLCADGSAKLGDFGLAFSLDQSRLTMPGTVMGTATYMAPEQARGEPVDARSDLYALGCLLYEMVCGRPPFSGDDPLSVISQHASVAPVAPVLHVAGLPPALNGLILRLLAKSPEDRPQSAAAVGEELHRISESLRQPASERTRFERPQRPRLTRRGRLLVAGTALTLIAGVAIAATLVFALRGHGQSHNTVANLPFVAENYTPALEPRVCPPELTSDRAVVCHDLVVPETRSNPAGRKVRILVMVAPSKAEHPGVPTVFIGGPLGTIYASATFGGSVLSQPAGLDVRDYGDVVAFGVRGRQFSQPLACPEVSGLWRELLALPFNGPEANKLFLDAADQCGRRLSAEGVDLNAYGQEDIVKDVRDLAIAMGWGQMNLQGSLDLFRVAVLLAAGYPDRVRSVVLEDPFPVDAAWYDDRLSNANAAFQAYYAACRDDPACERAFPNLQQAVPAAHAKDQQEPPVVNVPDPAGGPDVSVLFDGDRLVDIARRGLSLQGLLPTAGAVWSSPLGSSQEQSALRTGATYVVLVSAPGTDGDAWGQNFSAYCEDVNEHVVRGALATEETLYALFRGLAGDPLLEVCSHWPTQARSRAIGPLETVSAAPALILTGALEPLAGPAYAQRAKKSFTHATVAVFPSLTSQVLTDGPSCISALRLAFLRDPKAKRDALRDGCIAQVPPIAFAGT
ncbi:MAG: protein kinase [Chloroflexota bacterium]|nr:protein kinase [Chloroflexota bacterium]